jgi:hypothetical protein
MEPFLFISDPQPKQSNIINNIEHTKALVNKPKLAYTYIEWKQLPTWTKTVMMTKYRKYTFTALLITPWTREHKKDSKACSYGNALQKQMTWAWRTWTFLRYMSYAINVLFFPIREIKFHFGWTVVTLYSLSQSSEQTLIFMCPCSSSMSITCFKL